jgi:hypothetical protein
LSREKTVTLSLRISEAAYNALQEDSKKQNTSINTIANQILMTYAQHDRHFKKYGLVKTSTPLFARILNAVSDDALIEAAKSTGTGELQSIVLSTTGELSVSKILDWLKRVGTYSNLYDYSEVSHGGRTLVTLSHQFGSKGSLFLVSYLDSLFNSVGKQIKIKQLTSSVTFEM